mmetsp:Transcript_23476/g.28701  ORF Transcript_23476/g.28701 Transcript_23476/m.28701 type:complete len:98 (-) Transcript_23476:765-1058(-)
MIPTLTPDRRFLTMQNLLMKDYVTRLINVCHKWSKFVIGGMTGQISIKNDLDANAGPAVSHHAETIDEKLYDVAHTCVSQAGYICDRRKCRENTHQE